MATLVRNGQVQVVAAVIPRGGRFLVGRRSPNKKSAPGWFCPISGGIEEGETEEQALVREVREEVGLTVEPRAKLGDVVTRDRSGRIHWWLTVIVSGEATLANDEHTELRWVTLAELRALWPVFEEDLEFFALAEGLLGATE